MRVSSETPLYLGLGAGLSLLGFTWYGYLNYQDGIAKAQSASELEKAVICYDWQRFKTDNPKSTGTIKKAYRKLSAYLESECKPYETIVK